MQNIAMVDNFIVSGILQQSSQVFFVRYNLQLSNSMKRILYYKECFYDLLGCAFAVTLLEYNYYSKRKCVKMAGM